MQYIDLHVHTTASDGTLRPSEAVRYAKERGLSAIAITDHDARAGIPEALAAGQELGLEVIPGIEISVDYNGRGIHILGYFIDHTAPSIDALLQQLVAERNRRNRLVVQAMQSDGLPISMEALQEKFSDSIIGRPHFAAALVELGLAENIRDAFDRYLNFGKKYFFKRTYLPIDNAFAAILGAGGKAVIAHPFQYRFPEEDLPQMIQIMKSAGAIGLECLYSTYSPEQVAQLRLLAARFDLCVTGGSDFHGSRKPHIEMGMPGVPYTVLEELRLR